jgi:hypothetical protein
MQHRTLPADAGHADERLLLACDRFMHLTEECALLAAEEAALLYRQHRLGYERSYRPLQEERSAWEAEIAATTPDTAAGRRAKAEAALCSLGMLGPNADLVRSALYEFISDTARQESVKGEG